MKEPSLELFADEKNKKLHFYTITQEKREVNITSVFPCYGMYWAQYFMKDICMTSYLRHEAEYSPETIQKLLYCSTYFCGQGKSRHLIAFVIFDI